MERLSFSKQRCRGSLRGSYRCRRYVHPGLLLLCFLVLSNVTPVQADGSGPDEMLDAASFDQRLNEQIPLDLVFNDETGRPVQLADSFGTKPVILVLAYYQCPKLCPLVLGGLVKSLGALPFDVGNQFNVLTVSINPRETPAIAATKKATYLQQYGRPGADEGWHFLTGDEASIQRLAQAVGFRYAYDAEQDQYAHPAGIIVLTPQGKVSRYFYGIEYSPRDLRLSLVEASANKIGSLVDQVLLRCYDYDPVTGAYTLTVMNVLRLAALATTMVLGTFMAVMLYRERHKKSENRALPT
jgi:protein SCO1/2